MSREIELKPCPCCGGKAEMRENHVYMDVGVSVRCTECNLHTRVILCDCTYMYFHGEKNVCITRERAEREVARLWNKRTGDAQGKQSEWISVDDDMPDPYVSVLVHRKDGIVFTDFVLASTGEFVQEGITHWMPLPEPKKEE